MPQEDRVDGPHINDNRAGAESRRLLPLPPKPSGERKNATRTGRQKKSTQNHGQSHLHDEAKMKIIMSQWRHWDRDEHQSDFLLAHLGRCCHFQPWARGLLPRRVGQSPWPLPRATLACFQAYSGPPRLDVMCLASNKKTKNNHNKQSTTQHLQDQPKERRRGVCRGGVTARRISFHSAPLLRFLRSSLMCRAARFRRWSVQAPAWLFLVFAALDCCASVYPRSVLLILEVIRFCEAV